MPAILTVSPEAYVLGKPFQIPWTLAVGLVTSNGICHFLQRTEPFRLLTHERLDLGHTLRLNLGRDVNEHESSGVQVIFTDSDEAGPTTHRCSDEGGAPIAESRHNAL